MRETLYIRLRAGDAGAATTYCVASPHAVASFPVSEAPLGEILAGAGTRRLVALVPGAEVRLSTVAIPARQPAKALQAAPYALEEQLAQDVDSLHFALGPRQADGQWPVAVVARARMDEWLAPFLERGLRPDAIVPETLCLPPADGDQWSALAEAGQVTVRTAPWAGFACVADDLPLFMALADPDKRASLRIVVPRGVAPDFTTLGWPVDLLPGFSAPLEALLQNLRLEGSINLLQGHYSQREDLLRLWQPWRATAILAASVFALAWVLNGVQAFQLGRAAEAQAQRNVERYQALFPAETRIVDLPAQLEQQLAALRGGGAKGAFLPLAQVLAEATRSAPGLTVQLLQYREGALYVGLTGGGPQALDSLRAWFGAQGAATLEVVSENYGAEGAQIRIKIALRA